MLGVNSERDVSGHDSTGNVSHPAGHHRHELGACELGQKRPDGERGFCLSHEDARCNVQGLGAARAHEARHYFGRQLDDELHDAVVIKHGEERGDKDNRGQHLEGKIKSKL